MSNLQELEPEPIPCPDASVDDTEIAMTPGGPRPRSDVHFVPPGGFIRHEDDEIVLVDKDGTVLHRAPIPKQKHSDVVPCSPPSSVAAPEAPDWVTGWISWSSWINTTFTPFTSFLTSWAVPPNPTTNNNQLIFLFNGLQTAGPLSILQPVLNWGVTGIGGGNFWTIASWYVVNGGPVYHSQFYRVQPGTVLTGDMRAVARGGIPPIFDGFSQFDQVPGTQLTVRNIPELVEATETLEAFRVQARSDYPVGTIRFTDINLRAGTEAPPLQWAVHQNTADSIYTNVITDGPTAGEVDILI